jgi:hypothetical protein
LSVHAGTILHVGGANVIDRLQSAGLGDVRLTVETIREVGNYLVVDKIPGEPDFTFTMESLDVTTDLMAFLTGKVGAQASGSPPGGTDPAGTSYRWEDTRTVNIVSPWKNPSTSSAGTIEAGHIIPGYFPTRVRYRFGVTDNATQEAELAGGSFYYATWAPVEEFATGNGANTTYLTADLAVGHRLGGGTGTEYRFVFGVLVGDRLMIEGVDYNVTGGNIGTPSAVSARARVASIQSLELEATTESEIEREMGSDEIVGRTINGHDCTGTMTVRAKDADAFISLLSKVTGWSTQEVFGYFNQGFTVPLTIQIVNPTNTGQTLKTLVVDDALFQPPGTPARVNAPTDFALRFDSQNGVFREVKGAYAP